MELELQERAMIGRKVRREIADVVALCSWCAVVRA